MLLSALPVRADTLASGVYVRTDSDRTTVVSPHARVSKRILDATEVDVTYAADIWTSASIDVRTSASLPVQEQRDELDVGVAHEWTDLKLSAGYRYSVENDYLSHGASAGAQYAFANNNATLALDAHVLFDTVGRAGAPRFSEALTTGSARLTFTQVLDPQMLAQLTYEIGRAEGYQASPYRKVGLGGSGFGCVDATFCLDEHEPGSRTRHAVAAELRRAFGDALSADATYRFIVDDWGLTSHTALLQLAWLAGDNSVLSLRYRFYLQSGVRFYERRYPAQLSAGAYTTRDREQSPMHDQRVGLDWEQRAQLDEDLALSVVLAAGGSVFDYSQFVGLSQVYALELTLALALVR